ncbi:MAG: 1-acyl-sn-glycerol-3-phosphate acyltransferase, partial [Clostridia bacterium]|nr:1-acyl-sn-glycerol-3-phosphate acyltransferase [Clostridia bacterium]
MKLTVGMRWGRILLNFLRPFIFLLFPYKMINKDKIPDGNEPLVVCCNHISMVDPAFLLLACKRPICFMAKDSLFKNKFLGYLLKHWFGVFPVARGKSDSTAITTAFSVLENNGILGIFPEGTRSKDGTMAPAKSGAALIVAKAQSNVLPCAVYTKSGQVKAFQKTTVVFGDVLTPAD